jgi:hypothetical protein
VHTQSSTSLLFLGQELRFGWSVRQEPDGDDAEENSDASFDEEDEWPPFVVFGVDFSETCSEKSTKCTRPIKLAQLCRSYMDSFSLYLQWSCTIEETDSEHQLMTPVKHCEVDDHAAL